jgi:hypothetical protein
MATRYSKIPTNSYFNTTSGRYRKIDDLYFVDITGEYESMWSPMFDATILEAGEAPVAPTPEEPKFIVDEQSRMMKLNPNYKEATDEVALSDADTAFGEMWGSAQFDCGPEDYTYMAEQSIKAVEGFSTLAKLLGTEGLGIDYTLEIIAKMAAKPVKKTPAKKSPAKKAAKKSAKKSPKKGRGR